MMISKAVVVTNNLNKSVCRFMHLISSSICNNSPINITRTSFHISQLSTRNYSESKNYSTALNNIASPKPIVVEGHYLENKSLTKKEISYLTLLSKSNLLPLDSPRNVDSFQFPLKNREEAIAKITKGIDMYRFIAQGTDGLTKQQVPFIVAQGGRGSGKSRMLVELPNIIRTIPQMQNTKVIYINFTNGLSLAQEKRDRKIVSMIVSRIVHSAFGHSIAESFPASNNKDMLLEVMSIISKKLQSNSGVEIAPTPIVLIFDEFQKATRIFKDIGTDLQHLLSYFIRKSQKQLNLLLIPALGGTLSQNDLKFLPVDHATSAIILPLPCLRGSDTESIIKSFPELNYSNSTKHIWDIIGCVPRHLEFAISQARHIMEKKEEISIDSFMSQVYLSTALQVLNLYGNIDRQQFMVLATICLSGLSEDIISNCCDKNYASIMNSFKEEGLLYVKNGRFQLPLIVLDQLRPQKDELPPNIFQDFVQKTKKPEWEILEELCLKTLICRFNVLSSSKGKTIRFGDLFEGAKYPVLLRGVELHVDTTVKSEINQKGLDSTTCAFKQIFRTGSFSNSGLLIQAKLQNETSNNVTYSPSFIANLYRNALEVARDTCVLIITNKKIDTDTSSMIRNGLLRYEEDKIEKKQPCPRLVVISRDCFPNFFNPFIADCLTTFSSE